jgi:prophage regulatory protein
MLPNSPEQVDPSTDDQLSVLLLENEVCALTRLSPVTIWRMERRGEFPRRIKIGAKRIAWSGKEVRGWLADRFAAREHRGATGAA